MGYRSDVFFAMKEQSFKDMLASFKSDTMCIEVLKSTNVFFDSSTNETIFDFDYFEKYYKIL